MTRLHELYRSCGQSPWIDDLTRGYLLRGRLDGLLEAGRPNLLVKIPATHEGVPAIQTTIADGRSIDVTLIFSLSRCEAVIETYLSGIEQLVAGDGDPSQVCSVASFVLGPVDAEADRRLEEIAASSKDPLLSNHALELRGHVAVAQARLAYAMFRRSFCGPRWTCSPPPAPARSDRCGRRARRRTGATLEEQALASFEESVRQAEQRLEKKHASCTQLPCPAAPHVRRLRAAGSQRPSTDEPPGLGGRGRRRRMWHPGKHKDRASDPGPARLATDCERLLDGSYLDSTCAAGSVVPCWAWLNKLTHCAESELLLIARRPFAFEQRPELHAWARTLSFLAYELVQSSARCGRAVTALQREALLPLEIEMMGAVFGPSELTRRVLVALEEHTRHRA